MIKQIYRKPFGQVYTNQPNIYQSRIIRSYPENALIRSKKMYVSSSPQKQCFQSQLSALVNSKKLIKRQETNIQTTSCVQRSRPKSLDFKNNLFQKLASKLHKQKECIKKENKQILYQYYQGNQNKENRNESNFKTENKQPIHNMISHKKSRAIVRYKEQVPDPTIQRQPIKFNKIKASVCNRRNDDDMDFVRTSQSQLKKMKNSLDMSPVY